MADGMTKVLTFTLDEEIYAFGIERVREVLDATAVTRLPQLPAFVKGVINLRGAVVPVIDLRRKLGMPSAERSDTSCIIIADLVCGGDILVVGALADAVREVVDIDVAALSAVPKIGTRVRADLVDTMVHHEGRFIILLALDRVLEINGEQAAEAPAMACA